MAPTVRTGAQATGGGNALNADQLVVDMFEEVFTYDKESSPLLTVVMNKAQVKAATATTVKMLEDEPIPEWDTTTATVTNSATTMTVTNPTYHRAGDLIKIPRTGEVVRVTAVNAATSTITMSRAWAGSGTAMNNGENLLNMGAAEMEGDLAPVAKSTVTVTKTNFLEIVKTPVHVTKTLDNVKVYGGNERLRQRQKAGAKHARQWEQILLHGRKKEDTSTGANPIRSAGGLDEHIQTNILAAGGPLTEAEFLSWLGDSMRYSVNGSQKKLLVCSRAVLASINSWGLQKLQLSPQVRATYGIDVYTYISGFGTINVLNHPLLEVGYAGYAYLLDMDGIWYRPGRRTQLETNIQAPGEDAWKDEYITEATYSFVEEKAFGMITGVTF